MDLFENIQVEPVKKSGLRQKADRARVLRSRTLICVLENPKNPGNIAAVMRNIDALGVNKLYIVSDTYKSKENSKLMKCSASACKWVYTRFFRTTKQCLDYLSKNRFDSLVTSPHTNLGPVNIPLEQCDFAKYKKLAIWFGNESKGISDEAILGSKGCIQIQMSGIIESINLAVSTGIVLYQAATQRKKYKLLGTQRKKTKH